LRSFRVGSILDSYGAVGYSATVFQGRESSKRNHGLTEKEGSAHPDSRSIYEIGSVTKVFTALLLRDLETQGIARLSDPANHYLPPESGIPGPHGKQVTLLHLATHTSGLPSMPSKEFIRPDDGQHPFSCFSTEDAHRFLRNAKLGTSPGSKFSYSNLGYALLGRCLEVASGESYDQLLKSRICGPLGLGDTSIDLDEEQRRRFCHGYSMRRAPKTHRRLEFMAPAGGIRSTANDLTIFLRRALSGKDSLSRLARGCMRIRKKLPDESIPKIQSGLDLEDLREAGIGLGWLVYELGSRTLVWHSGGTRGFSCFVGLEQHTQTGIVFLTNTNGEITNAGLRALLKVTH